MPMNSGRGSGRHRSRISQLMLVVLAAMACGYVAGCLWQDAQNSVYLLEELGRKTWPGQHATAGAMSVDEALEREECRDQHKRLAALEMELAAARKEGFNLKSSSETGTRKKLAAVIGVMTSFDGKMDRDVIRKSWLPTDAAALKSLEEEKGIVVRFVIGRSSNRGDGQDRAIVEENKSRNDFMVLDDHIEDPNESPRKTKSFFIRAAETWDAVFYVKVNDDIFLDIDALGDMLAGYREIPRSYIGCMKSGEVYSDPDHEWYEPDWWKFGDGKSYFQHAAGQIFAVSRPLAQFISINRDVLRTYAHDDVSVGSWLIGLDVDHIHEEKLCCSSGSSGVICADT